ncbi:MAG: hypothetical protein KF819_05910 [Labilithrix sp.]|nr:hypothetical protein [Labilithrix sp.]
MSQQPSNQSIREEERVLGIVYDRAVTMVPRLIQSATGAAPQELGDGYFVVETGDGGARRQVTVRLGRQGADTRVSVRVETFTRATTTIIIVLVAIFTAGFGILPLIPWLQSVTRKQAQERDLLVHRTFRAIEDAVAEQGAAGNYRIAPGADGNVPMSDESDVAEAVRRSSLGEGS